MAKSYYSTIFDETADQVWAEVRDFGRYEWAEGVGPVSIEGGKAGEMPDANTPGAIRSFEYYGTPGRQRLVAHSDAVRFHTYASTAPYESLRSYEVTLRVTPVVDGDHSFVEWWAEFDAPPAEYGHWNEFFVRELAKSLEKLRRHFAGLAHARPGMGADATDIRLG